MELLRKHELFPPEVLNIYKDVMNGSYDSLTPEQDIDNILMDWFSTKCSDKFAYLEAIKQELSINRDALECFLFRLNLDGITEQIQEKVVIYSKPVQKLFGYDKSAMDSEYGMVYSGKNALEITSDELETKADQFYSDKETIKESVIGNTAEVRTKILDRIRSMNFEPTNNSNALRERLDHHLKLNQRSSIIGRIAYLIAIAEIKGNTRNLLK